MDNLSKVVIDNIVNDCINLYTNLPKSGKPIDREWTVLSCVIQYDSKTEKYRTVSLGTGSKCIGASKMSPGGNILNDSHGEVIARRGFLIYLYDNILKCIHNKDSIFLRKEDKFELKDEFKFIFYSSQLPCGDACIMPKSDDECHGDILLSKKHKAESDVCDINAKKAKFELCDDIYRTGAKCLPHMEQDSKESGKNYHLLGRVRTKPGRGDRTLSVSCSDKIARWIHVGIQGSLLDMLLTQPIFINSYIFGAGVPYSEAILTRSLMNRATNAPLYTFHPKFYQSSVKFIHLKNFERIVPVPTSIVWVDTSEKIIEVAVQGKRLGVTKKKSNSIDSYLSICKYNMFRKFLEVLKSNDTIKLKICNEKPLENIQYSEIKNQSKKYKDSWMHIKENFFKTWTVKPDMWNFCVSDI